MSLRVAVVVQRWHPDIAGGSEALAWQYARLLAAHHRVELLTSCATDYVTWDNTLPEGASEIDGVHVRRFRVAAPRGSYFTGLHRRLLDDFAARKDHPPADRLPWPDALAEEFLKAQGPDCPGLIEHLGRNHADYHVVLFVTYLYPTSYCAAAVVPRQKRILIPTLHDEPPAYLRVLAARAREEAEIIWLTAAERGVARKLWDLDRGEVLGMAVEDVAPGEPERRDCPYLLYCGRIDANKGSPDMVEAFTTLRRRGVRARLLLTGSDHMGLPRHPDIEFLGFVSAERKRALMAGAHAFVMPSPFESFSIVTLEAMAQGTPVIVNGDCAVLAEHVQRAGSGRVFSGRIELADAMQAALSMTADTRHAEGNRARAYVLENYTRERIAAQLTRLLQRVAAD